jgi:hypothetical protein
VCRASAKPDSSNLAERQLKPSLARSFNPSRQPPSARIGVIRENLKPRRLVAQLPLLSTFLLSLPEYSFQIHERH